VKQGWRLRKDSNIVPCSRRKLRPTPYSLILGARTGTRRVLASSHPAQRDAAKTIPLQTSSRSEQVRYSRLAASPLLARSDRESNRPGGRAPKVDLERVDLKVISANRRLQNYSRSGVFSQPNSADPGRV